MISKVAAVGLASALMTMGAGTPAQAEPRQCAKGSWRQVSEELRGRGVHKSERWTQHIWGGAGVKLTIGNGRATYDFNTAKKEFLTVTRGGRHSAYWSLSRKTLRINMTLTGDRRGTFITRARTAAGNASTRTVQTRPVHKDWGRQNIARSLKLPGNWDTLVAGKAAYTCDSGKLVLTVRQDGRNADSWWKNKETLTYRRV